MSRSSEDSPIMSLLLGNATDPACIEDLSGINAVRASIISGLDDVEVGSLPVDPLERWSLAETSAALHSADPILRAKEYLDRVLSTGDSANREGAEYASRIAQAFESRAVAEEQESAERNARAVAQIDALGEIIRRQQTACEGVRAASEERTSAYQQAVLSSAARVRDFNAALSSITAKLNLSLLNMNAANVAALRRHEQRRFRRHLFHVGQLLGYAILVVVVGVLAGDALNDTKFASLWAALAVAFVLWGVDRWLISPRLERWNRRQELTELKRDLTSRAESLAIIRTLQSSLDLQADDVGVPRVALLNPDLVQLPG